MPSARGWGAGLTAALTALVWIAACDGRPPVGPEEVGPPVILSDTAAASDPSVNTSAVSDPPASQLGTGATATNVTFVSMPPGTVPIGVTATIRNAAGGDEITVEMANGGFDPVAVKASPGDVLIFEIRLSSGVVALSIERKVPARRRPRVVRTNPPPKKRDVALNASIIIVFSEPIDAATVADAVRLQRGATSVDGRVELRDADNLTFAFVPAAPLAAATDYELVVTQAVRDQDGEPLEAAVAVPFTTRTLDGAAGASVILVPDEAATIQEAVDLVGAGGVVRVRPGVYDEALEINKGLAIERATETGEVRIVPPDDVKHAILITTAEQVALGGITIDHLGREPRSYVEESRVGVYATGPANVTIAESAVLRANFGVYIDNDQTVSGQRARLEVRNTMFDGGQATRMESGPFLATDVDAVLQGNTVRRTLWSCIQVQGRATADVIENDVDLCGVQGGIRVYVFGERVNVIRNTVRNSERSASRYGIFVSGATGSVERNTVVDYVQPSADPAYSPGAIRLQQMQGVVRFNDVSGNSHAGLRNVTLEVIDATCNWWGAADGPSGAGGGAGDIADGPMAFVPFATAPIAGTAEIDCSGVPHPPAQLAFTVQPTTTVAGKAVAPAIRVTALDAAGKKAPTFTGTVTLALGTNPGGSVMSGSTTAWAVNGVATFYDVRLDRTGSGYTLTASSPGLQAGVSALFDIVEQNADVVYANDFEAPPGAEWSHRRRNTAPNERFPNPTFLGEFGCIDYDTQEPSPNQADNCRSADTVTLSLASLPAHDAITITFDLYLLRTWDGNGVCGLTECPHAPDVFHVSVVGGPTLLNATFSVHPQSPYQSYPDPYPVDGSPAPNNARHMGAFLINTLGYDMDAVYRLTFTFAHSASTLALRFTAPELRQLWDESWGLDNVEVKVKRLSP